MSQTMQNDIHIVIGLNIVETHNPWNGEWRMGNEEWNSEGLRGG